MALVACTCIRFVDLRTIALRDPACPADAVHTRAVADARAAADARA
ncbi:hypothetical protein [Cellulomonas cellasea]|uniref:Uncharacterized protein n=2 Tax=Cellulomonas cellasea TaxID=43670 RepID=A0A0A0B375_9CELL|nr:hypothetical protein [Cellulomonas cellasea]KGM00632.1 hypothetical protein Q760_07050 [Cellulomonas cellasea DSM 20118]GEA87465.1 hypothetical protein CCE01nite_14140 [Cellulomonas cellasea]